MKPVNSLFGPRPSLRADCSWKRLPKFRYCRQDLNERHLGWCPSLPGSRAIEPQSESVTVPRPAWLRLIWIALGAASLLTGIIGIVLPLLPTTPFLLLAAFCFARGSERLHVWLVTHPRLGPPIDDWRRHGAISRSAKRLAFIAMAAVVVIALVAGAPLYAIGLQIAVLSIVAVFIATRPVPPGDA